MFIAKIYWAFVKLILEINLDRYKEIFQEDFPIQIFQKLQLLIVMYTRSHIGLWKLTTRESTSWNPINYDTLSIEGKRAFTLDELKKGFSFLLK